MAGKTSCSTRCGCARPATDADSGRTIGLDIEQLTLHDPRAPGGLRLLCYDAGGHDEYGRCTAPSPRPTLACWCGTWPSRCGGRMRPRTSRRASWRGWRAGRHHPSSGAGRQALLVDHADGWPRTLFPLAAATLAGVRAILAQHRGTADELRQLGGGGGGRVGRSTAAAAGLRAHTRLPNWRWPSARTPANGMQTGTREASLAVQNLIELRQRIVDTVFDADAPTVGQQQPPTAPSCMSCAGCWRTSSVTWARC